MKKSAIFTIVKDEKYFLDKWIKYYSQFFDPDDIYVLDHQSKDGSTNGIGVNVIEIQNEMAFDHLWLVDQVEKMQKDLLKRYEVVIFTEVDEILYSSRGNLGFLIEDIRKNSNFQYMTSLGYEIKQNPEKGEKRLEFGDPIMENRNYWFRYPSYDKTLITKIPLKYNPGFHSCNYRPLYGDLFLLHLHRVDFNLLVERRKQRISSWNLKRDDLEKGWGTYHGEEEYEKIKFHFNHTHTGEIISLDPIPEEHKKCIHGL